MLEQIISILNSKFQNEGDKIHLTMKPSGDVITITRTQMKEDDGTVAYEWYAIDTDAFLFWGTDSLVDVAQTLIDYEALRAQSKYRKNLLEQRRLNLKQEYSLDDAHPYDSLGDEAQHQIELFADSYKDVYGKKPTIEYIYA